jgi:hypothetical protein
MESWRTRWAGFGFPTNNIYTLLFSPIREKRNAYRILVGNPDRKRPPGRPRRRWVDNIKVDLGEIGWSGTDWIGLAQDNGKWKSSCEYCNKPSSSLKCSGVLEWLQNRWLLEYCSAP